MNVELAKFITATLPAAACVFCGSLPLMGVIARFAFQQSNRMVRVEGSLDKLADVVSTLSVTVAVLADRDTRPVEPSQ